MKQPVSLCENALNREARRILRKLIAGGILLPRSRGDYGLVHAGGNADAARMVVAADSVAVLLGRGLLVRDAGGLAVSAAGIDWYGGQAGGLAEGYGAQHRLMEVKNIADDNGGHRQVAVNLRESALSLLRARGLISPMQADAGERLGRDYTQAQMTGRLCADWNAPRQTGTRPVGAVMADAVLDARERVRRAMRAVGPELSGVLFDLCCAGSGLADVEKRYGWPRASAKVVLSLALDRLARHYGMGVVVSHVPVRSWMQED